MPFREQFWTRDSVRSAAPGCWQVAKWRRFPRSRTPEALTFENNAESVPADVEGLMTDTAQALDIFRDMVTSSGGTFALKSAYRPPAYQAHLHDVWVKWMKELRNNRTAGCQALREEVGAEFRRH